MAEPKEGRVELRLCACRREVLVGLHPVTGEVLGCDFVIPTPVEEAQLALAGRATYEYRFDHEGHSWLSPRSASGSVRRRVLGEEPDRIIVVAHDCAAPFTDAHRLTNGAPA